MTLAFPSSARARLTIRVGRAIRRTGYRFDASWRHADLESLDRGERLKAQFYQRCCTFAANDIADKPEKAAWWGQELSALERAEGDAR